MHTIYNTLTDTELLRVAAMELDNPGVAEVMPVVAELFTRFKDMAQSTADLREIFDRFDLNGEQVADILERLRRRPAQTAKPCK